MVKFLLAHRIFFLILGIFIVAIIVRFLHFPDNVHFAFDQARDSFTSLEIFKGDFKLVGPPSIVSDKLFPGPLIFHIYAPIYFFFNKSPEAASAIFRIWNALGVFLVFSVGSIIFNKRVGIIAAIFFAFSYEQSQYSLFLSHQPLAVITILLFYLGLTLYIFQRKSWGIVLAAAGSGLSIQFHYGFIFLLPALIISLVLFRRRIKTFKIKWVLLSLLVFILTIFSFILAELKYHFLSNLILEHYSTTRVNFSGLRLQETLFIINRYLHDSFLANYQFTPLLGILFLVAIIYLFFQRSLREKTLFLIIWFTFGLSLYLLSGVSSYYYSPATTVSLFFIVSYLIDKFFSAGKILIGCLLIIAIVINNLFSIITINPQGLNSDMVIQPGMVTSNQKRVLDYIYLHAEGKPFAVGALTIPLNIKTTWDYLFNWYGKEKYGYLPFWIGPTASGYAGNLRVIDARSKLPKKQFLIIEPTVGIREVDKEKFFREEEYFTKVIEERKFGTITVQSRKPH